ncbi:DUF4124 domain-containing protein [Pseudoduganella sp. RAF53_2]|uniref:DUF4124 domain-containing protein n=1 Tax=unclassified Pseudoduganella TaxID=2637179 RepID=UPI003F9CE36D
MQRTAIGGALCAAAMVLSAHGALAQDEVFHCKDNNGTTVLTDKPCNALQAMSLTATPAPVTTEHIIVKEHFTLPPTEAGRERWASKPPTRTPPKIDIATLRAARLALDLREQVASAR